MQVKMGFKREEAEEELARKLPEIKANPQLQIKQRALTSFEVGVVDAVITAMHMQLPADIIAEHLMQLGLAAKFGKLDVKVLEAGNEFGRDLLRRLPPTLN